MLLILKASVKIWGYILPQFQWEHAAPKLTVYVYRRICGNVFVGLIAWMATDRPIYRQLYWLTFPCRPNAYYFVCCHLSRIFNLAFKYRLYRPRLGKRNRVDFLKFIIQVSKFHCVFRNSLLTMRFRVYHDEKSQY